MYIYIQKNPPNSAPPPRSIHKAACKSAAESSKIR